MILTRSEFDEKYKNNELKIAFIGMSNIGKSHWTTALAKDKGFASFSVDPAISESLGIEGMEDFAKWMGYPFETHYQKRAKAYLDLETKYTQGITCPEGQNFALDTTGSVIHLNDKIHQKLKENYLIVTFDVSVDMVSDMIEDFFRVPKPVIWGESFVPGGKESDQETLRRCYPKLLAYRIEKYRSLGDVFIPGEFSRIKGLPLHRFWEVLRLSLPS